VGKRFIEGLFTDIFGVPAQIFFAENFPVQLVFSFEAHIYLFFSKETVNALIIYKEEIKIELKVQVNHLFNLFLISVSYNFNSICIPLSGI
jgi:hypothetical protein